MTEALALLKVFLKEDFISENKLTDTELEAYLSLASNSIKRHKGCTTVSLTEYLMDIVRIAQLNILKAGAEGQLSHLENGIDRVYSYPEIENEVLRHISTTLK